MTRSHLVDGATHWYKIEIQEITTWDQFEHFKNTFIREKCLSIKWKRMTERNKKKRDNRVVLRN